MKMNHFYLVLICLLTSDVIADDWIKQTIDHTPHALYGVYAVSANVVIAVGNIREIIRTADGGENWTTPNVDWSNSSDTYNPVLNNVFFVNENVGYIAGSDGLVLKTIDGGENWIEKFTPGGEWLQNLFFLDENNGWFVGANGTVLYTTDGCDTYHTYNTGFSSDDDLLRTIYFVDPNHGFISGDNSNFLQTSNGGTDWIRIYSDRLFWYQDLMFSDSQTGWLVGLGEYFYKTENAGLDWNPLPIPPLAYQEFYVVHFINNSIGWMGGYGSALYKTINGGVDWIFDPHPLCDFIRGISFADHNNGWIVGNDEDSGEGIILHISNASLPVELSEFTVKYHDDTQTIIINWATASETNNYGFEIQISNNLSFDDWKSIGFLTGHGTSTNQNNYSFNYTLPNSLPSDTLFVRLKQVDRNGDFTCTEPVMLSVHFTPHSILLAQNYPNPFNASTRIQYTLSEPGYIKLVVFNRNGQYITTLVDKQENPGNYSIIWEPDFNLSSGLYFYDLQFEQSHLIN